MSSLKQKTFNNVAFNAIAKVISFFFQAVANVILSRALLSSDYGVVGFALIFVNFLSQFSELGLNSAIIQRKELSEKTLYTGFTMKLGLGVFIYFVVFITSGLAVFFFDNHAVVNVIKALALNFVINSFAFLPLALLKRDLDYKKISIANVCQTICNSSLAIILALAGFKYWSIVVANLCATLAMVLALNYLKPIRIKFVYDKEAAHSLMAYGTNLSMMSFLIFLLFNLDNFIIGAIKGSSELGYYMIAFNWGSIICIVLGTVVNSVIFPTFSKINDDIPRIKRSYIRVLEYVSFVGVLANLTLFLVSRDFLVQLLGNGTEKWLPALTSLKILCFYGIIRFLLEPIANVLMALGLTKLMLKANLLAAVIEIVMLYPVLKYFGIEGVAVLITLTYTSQYFIYFPVLRKELGINFKEFLQPIMPAIYAGTLVTLIFISINSYTIYGGILDLLLKAALVVSCYLAVHGVITNWKLLREAKGMITDARIVT
jgi:lipopolysaccharide exporter